MNPRLDRSLTALLRYGSWLASGMIGLGLVLTVTGLAAGTRVMVAGIGLFIALPPTRVIVMLIEFLRARDYRLAISAALVLVVIGLGLVIR